MESLIERIDINDEEDEGFEIHGIQPVAARQEFALCDAGTLLTTRSYNFNAMKLRLSEVWQPGRGIQIVDLGNRLILFRFFHIIDLTWVLDAGPWNFNGHLLLIHKLEPGENPITVPLTSTKF
ncbi:hypothetical protein LINPERPRIM_LOCUS15571 [Linum perenne]